MASRITLAQIMCMVAVLALAFAMAPAPLAIAFSLVLLLALGIAIYFRVPWPRIAGWMFACYPLLPLLTLYTTWGAAWYSLARVPRPSLDDPKSIGPLVDAPHLVTWLLLLGLLPALAVNVALVGFEFIRMLHDEHDDLKRFISRVALPILSWPLAYLWMMADPGGVMNWFMD